MPLLPSDGWDDVSIEFPWRSENLANAELRSELVRRLSTERDPLSLRRCEEISTGRRAQTRHERLQAIHERFVHRKKNGGAGMRLFAAPFYFFTQT